MNRSRFLAILTTLVMSLPVTSMADAINLPTCTVDDPRCGFTISVGEGLDKQEGSGFYSIGSDGTLTITKAVTVFGLNGETATVGDISGNADPILGFSASASTGATGGAFSFTFSLPIALSGPLAANSSVSYSLTSQTAAGAQIAPLIGTKVVIAQEVDTSVGGIGTLNKGVDVGNTFFFVGGPATQNSPVYTAASLLTGNLAYDLMSVTVAFSLSARSNTGLSGFVEQTVVPIPAAVWLFGSTLGLMGVMRRKVS